MGHNNQVITLPTEIVTPVAALGFTLTDVQRTYRASTFFTYEKDGEKKFFACGSNAYGQLGLGHNRK